ncbi:MAG: hypothetical protein ACF8LL_14675, partial [Phycisphaerales bacterium]
SEIPAAPPSVQAQDAGVSDSARARPAIDEMLSARVKSTQPIAVDASMDASSGQHQPVSQLREELLISEPRIGGSQPEQQGAVAGETLTGRSSLPSLSDGWGQTIIALGGVILLIFGVAQFFKRLSRSQGGLVGQLGAGGAAPSGILEVIGRYPITTGMTLVVLKFDRRVLLVASSSATRGKHAKNASMQTLCELSDPEDVASILMKARSADGDTIAQSFQRALQDADDFTDDSIYRYDEPLQGPRHTPQQRTQPKRTITSDEGDRAELWSDQGDGLAAAKVLRQRLASMRQGQRAG